MKKIRTRKIRYFITGLILLIMIPVMFLCSVGIHKNSEEVRRRNLNYWESVAQDIIHDLDKEIQGYDKLSMSVLIQDELLDILYKEKLELYEYIQACSWMDRQFAVELYLNESLLRGFCVIGNNGFYYFNGEENSLEEIEKIIEETPTSGQIKIFMPDQNKGKKSRGEVTIARYINSYKDVAALGYFVMNLKTTNLDTIWRDKKLDNIMMYILDENGNQIYGEEKQKRNIPQMGKMTEQSGDFYSEDHKNYYIYKKSDYTDWMVVLDIPCLLYQETLWSITGVFLLAGGVTILLSSLVAYQLIRWVYAKELEEKEMEAEKNRAELKALQTQINPHFLYNTLGAINMYAVCEDCTGIQDITDKLSQMFRYAVQNPMDPVRIGEEIEHVKNYLKIQEYRLGILPQISIEMEGMEQVYMLRLTLQPIIENVFKHGFVDGVKKEDHIWIRARKEEKCLIVEVADNGKGPSIDIEEMEFISDGEKNGRGIGLSNVHKRLKLAYGQEYGLTIFGKKGKGMTIRIRQPYIQKNVSIVVKN